jgi:hypothetical protein
LGKGWRREFEARSSKEGRTERVHGEEEEFTRRKKIMFYSDSSMAYQGLHSSCPSYWARYMGSSARDGTQARFPIIRLWAQ